MRQTFPPTMDAARTARQFVVSTLAAWGCATDEDVMVVTNELLINAVEHAQSTYEVRIIDKVSRVRVEVRDWSDRQPVVSDTAPDATSGRGLRMVSQLAPRWGIEPAEEGKTVWFEVDCSSGTALSDGDLPAH